MMLLNLRIKQLIFQQLDNSNLSIKQLMLQEGLSNIPKHVSAFGDI